MDRNVEVQPFAEADRHIFNAERAIGHQIMEVKRLREGGHCTALAEKTLVTFQHTLSGMQNHRDLIIKTIEDIDAGLI